MKTSELARPPITQDEAGRADTSICPHHKGLVLQTGDTEGAVFFCPIGKQFWRYTRQRGGMYAPLNYSRSGIL